MSDMTHTVSDLAVRFAALEGAHRYALPSSRSQNTALPLPEPAVQPVMLVRHRPGTTGQTTHAVHLASLPDQHMAGMVGTLCGAVLSLDDIDTVTSSRGMPCTMCLLHHVTATAAAVVAPVDSPDSDDAGLINEVAYQAWAWPVTQHRDQIRLRLDCDVSAIAIPIPLSTEVIELLTARHCDPAVLAHPDTPEHHLILTGEKFPTSLPWPPGVHQITDTLTLPPTITPHGPITWIRAPHQDSLHLSREIDVFGALRAILGDSTGDHPPPTSAHRQRPDAGRAGRVPQRQGSRPQRPSQAHRRDGIPAFTPSYPPAVGTPRAPTALIRAPYVPVPTGTHGPWQAKAH
ncbi:MAG: hypothetical protein WBL53_11600 [Pseudonocardiaceae bacterium]